MHIALVSLEERMNFTSFQLINSMRPRVDFKNSKGKPPSYTKPPCE